MGLFIHEILHKYRIDSGAKYIKKIWEPSHYSTLGVCKIMPKAQEGTERVYGIDGDKVGGVIDAYFIRNEVSDLSLFSAKVASAMDEIRNAVIQGDGKVVFFAGDSILFLGNFEDQWCDKILNLFLTITGRTASMGVGDTATEAYLALKLAKADGGGKVIGNH